MRSGGHNKQNSETVRKVKHVPMKLTGENGQTVAGPVSSRLGKLRTLASKAKLFISVDFRTA
jgi:hypothetical protein